MQRSAQNTNANAKAALVEAQEIEAIVQTLMGRAGAHAQRIERMKSYCQGVGVAQVVEETVQRRSGTRDVRAEGTCPAKLLRER